jgi:hypothetical protein
MICESYLARDKNMCIKTFNEMYKGIPLIYQGILQNPENKTLGSVDLLVRDDYINDITESEYQIEKFESIFPHKHFYYAVDIKNSKLHFNVDNVTLRNNTNVKPFKFQLYVYNEALKYMQDVNTSKAFILGNSWKMERTESKKKISDSKRNKNKKYGIEIDKKILNTLMNTITGKQLAIELSTPELILNEKYVQRIRSDFVKKIVVYKQENSDIKSIMQKLKDHYTFEIKKESILCAITLYKL